MGRLRLSAQSITCRPTMAQKRPRHCCWFSAETLSWQVQDLCAESRSVQMRHSLLFSLAPRVRHSDDWQRCGFPLQFVMFYQLKKSEVVLKQLVLHKHRTPKPIQPTTTPARALLQHPPAPRTPVHTPSWSKTTSTQSLLGETASNLHWQSEKPERTT